MSLEQSPEAIQAAVRRAALLLEDLRGIEGVGNVAVEAAEFQRLAAQAGGVASLDERSRFDLYHRIRTLTRSLAFKNPLVTSRPILFMQRRRAVGYMLYEYLGWYYAHGNDPTSGLKNPKFPTPKPGGGVYVLEQPGRTLQTRELISGPRLQGHFVTLALAWDARTIYFAFADPAGKDPYATPGYALASAEPGVKYNTFHIVAMDADGSHVRQLTDGPYDDFDPCPLPDPCESCAAPRDCQSPRACRGFPGWREPVWLHGPIPAEVFRRLRRGRSAIERGSRATVSVRGSR